MKLQALQSSAVSLTVLVTVLVIGAIAIPRVYAKEETRLENRNEWDTYDWVRAESNLREIGAAIQLLRQHNGILPVSQRRSGADAGLGEKGWLFVVEIAKPDKPWSVSKTSLFPPSTYMPPPPSLKFLSYYNILIDPRRFDAETEPTDDDLANVWASRGEETPILLDPHMHNPMRRHPGDPEVPVLILRLNGQVDRVMADPKNRRDILLNK